MSEWASVHADRFSSAEDIDDSSEAIQYIRDTYCIPAKIGGTSR